MNVTREIFLSKCDLQRVKVEIPEWGISVYVRELTALERGQFEATASKGDIGATAKLRADLTVKCAVNSDGIPLLTASDREAIDKMSGNIIDRIFTAALNLSGMWPGDGMSAEGNLPPTTGDDSA